MKERKCQYNSYYLKKLHNGVQEYISCAPPIKILLADDLSLFRPDKQQIRYKDQSACPPWLLTDHRKHRSGGTHNARLSVTLIHVAECNEKVNLAEGRREKTQVIFVNFGEGILLEIARQGENTKALPLLHSSIVSWQYNTTSNSSFEKFI